MTGKLIAVFRFRWKSPPQFENGIFYLDTDFGKVRVFDSKGNLPIIIHVPDGSNIIEHQIHLIADLDIDYRRIYFEHLELEFYEKNVLLIESIYFNCQTNSSQRVYNLDSFRSCRSILHLS